MSPRILLAILILTNPICCQMFGSTGYVRSQESVAGCESCACDCEPCQSPAENVPEKHVPCGCPNCELCQCVCAGAIVKDAVTIDNMAQGSPADVIAEDPIIDMSPPSDETRSFDTPITCGQTNVGRAARIQHASLLC